ncbi:MAG: hypothetical protein QXU61_01210 [Archaeoglobaceae archaeon]
MKHSSFVSLESYPEYDPNKIDLEAEKIEEYLERLLEDIKEVKKFVESAKVVYIYPAEEWKIEALKIAREKGLKEALKFLASKGIDKSEISFFAKKFNDAEIIPNERKLIEENIEFLERELQLKVSLESERIPVEKRRAAMPGRPAIFID